jgi:TolB-like protein/tRNA A-37 threonylcarbamoyl transferase component Bud32
VSDKPSSPVEGRLARYRILGKLGAGGMGEVYRARDEQLDRDVAVRVLPASTLDDPTERARLVREAKAAAALNHPNICTVYEVGEADDRVYLAMELVEGRTLRETLTDTALAPDLLVHYARQLAEALAHAHDRGVAHHDLKSGNVIVTADRRIKVLDFGLAKRAPGQPDDQTVEMPGDVQALGAVLHEMAAGLGSQVPPAIRTVIERCLEKDPTRRFRSAGDVRTALEGVQKPAAATPLRVVAASLTRRRALWLAAAVAVIASGLTTWWLWPAGVAERSLAVLPFENRLEDEDVEHLCEGVAESLIRQMSVLRSLKVINFGTVLNFKGQPVDPRAAGKQLRAEAVLSGSIERQGNRLAISARLTDVATGRELWTNSFNRVEADLLDVQDEIASAIMNEGLRVRLTNDQQRRLARRPTVDGEAYDLYLQSAYLQRRATEEDYLYSRELLQRAVARDPQYARAWAALSGNYGMMATDGFERPTDAWPQVSRYIRQALEIDPDLIERHAIAHGLSWLFDWDWAGAERARQLLLQLPSGDLDPHWLRPLAGELFALGRFDEAIQIARRTRELDPLSPYLAILEADYLLRAGRFDAAVALYERSIRVDPDNSNAHFGLAEARYRQGRFDEAIDARRKAHAVAGDDALNGVLSTARGEQGYREIEHAWVRLQLDELKKRQATSYVSPLDLARAYAQLGEKDLTFKYLDASFVDRSPGLVFLKVDRAWDTVRADPRFAEAVRRVGLP